MTTLDMLSLLERFNAMAADERRDTLLGLRDGLVGPGTPPSPAPSRPRFPTDPGYCYLCLFSLTSRGLAAQELGVQPTRSAVERYLEENPSAMSPRRFRVTFGTRASVDRSQKLLAHVEEVPDSESYLTARDVAWLMPPHARYGEGPESAVYAPPAPSSAPDLHLALGRPAPSTSRRFLYSDWGFNTTAADGALGTHTIDPVSGAHVASFLAFASVARYTLLVAHVVPGPYAHTARVSFSAAWHASNEAAPSSAALMQKSPSHQVACLGGSAEGSQASWDLPFVEGYGVSCVAKPAPHFGGSPRISIRGTYVNVADPRPPAGNSLYGVWIELVVDTSC